MTSPDYNRTRPRSAETNTANSLFNHPRWPTYRKELEKKYESLLSGSAALCFHPQVFPVSPVYEFQLNYLRLWHEREMRNWLVCTNERAAALNLPLDVVRLAAMSSLQDLIEEFARHIKTVNDAAKLRLENSTARRLFTPEQKQQLLECT